MFPSAEQFEWKQQQNERFIWFIIFFTIFLFASFQNRNEETPKPVEPRLSSSFERFQREREKQQNWHTEKCSRRHVHTRRPHAADIACISSFIMVCFCSFCKLFTNFNENGWPLVGKMNSRHKSDEHVWTKLSRHKSQKFLRTGTSLPFIQSLIKRRWWARKTCSFIRRDCGNIGGQKPSDSGTTTNSLFLDHLNNKLCSVSLKYVKTCSKIESFYAPETHECKVTVQRCKRQTKVAGLERNSLGAGVVRGRCSVFSVPPPLATVSASTCRAEFNGWQDMGISGWYMPFTCPAESEWCCCCCCCCCCRYLALYL